jgi:hypothetical protein
MSGTDALSSKGERASSSLIELQIMALGLSFSQSMPQQLELQFMSPESNFVDPARDSDRRELPTQSRGSQKSRPKKKKAKSKGNHAAASTREKESRKTSRKKRTQRPYPVVAFNQATAIGDAIHRFASGEKIRRLTLLEKLGLSQTSSSTMMLITNSGKYKITKGGYTADWLELTQDGYVACDPNAAARPKLDARYRLAIAGVLPFKVLYEEGVGKKLVAREVMYDWLDVAKIKIEDKAECVDIFVTNVKELGLLRTIAGSETLIPIDQALDEAGQAPRTGASVGASPAIQTTQDGWDTVCFYLTPIGDPETAIRKHSDLFKSSIVEPAMEELGLRVIRADEMDTPGMITRSILEHIKRSKLVIADLSMLNPNVFYELALRHACKLPIVQIRQKGEELPFDVGQVNTLTIDNSDLYNFVPQIESFRSELATLARNAIENPEQVSNPLTVFYPEFWN